MSDTPDLFGESGPSTFTLGDQIRCVERELAMRKSAYPRWIARGKILAAVAEREIAVMEQVLRTLRALDDQQLPLELPR